MVMVRRGVHAVLTEPWQIDKRLEAVERLYNALRKALRNAELAERVSIGCVDKSER